MKKIIDFCLNNKFAVWLLTLIVAVAGIYSGTTMKKETIPNINIPYLSIMSIYPGSSPEGVVDQVTDPIEQRLKNLSGVKNIISTSMENASSVIIEFEYGQDLDKTTSEINEILANIEFPDGVQKPEVTRFSMNSIPVVSLTASNDQSLEELTSLIEDEIQPDLAGIEGVASVQIAGQYTQKVQIKFNQTKMAELGLTEDTVTKIIQASAVKAPLGLFELDKTDKALVIDGKIGTLDDLKNLSVPVTPTTQSGQAASQSAQSLSASAPADFSGLPTVKLQDLAEISIVGTSDSISHVNGKDGISINVIKANDANTVEVVNGVKAKIDSLEKDHSGLKLNILTDQGKPIEDSVSTMLHKAVFGALIAAMIILLFLRNLRSTIVSIISIPLSLLIGVLVLNRFGYTLNIMTLGAMTVAIGRVVDDSIVVIENIYRRMSLPDEPLKGKALIREATKEMFIPISASTIVTIAVFLPLGLVSGMVGELFLPFALTMVFSLLASLLVAITVVPMFSHTLFRKQLAKADTEQKSHQHEHGPGKIARFYQRILGWGLNHKLVTFGGAVLLLVGSLFLIPSIGFSFLPDQQEKYILLSYQPAPGETLEDVKQDAVNAEKTISGRQGVEQIQYSIGGNSMFSTGSSKSAQFTIVYDSETKDFADEKKDLLNELKSNVSSGDWKETEDTSAFGSNKLTFTVYGEKLEEITPVVNQISDLMSKNTSFDKVETGISKTYEQYTLVADQEKMSKYGLTAGQLAMLLSPAQPSSPLIQIEVNGKTEKVYVASDKTEYKTLADIENAKLQSPLGMEVSVKDVANVEKGSSPNSITRQNGKIAVDVSANVTTKDVSKASSDLQAEVDKLSLPNGVEVHIGGVAEQMNDTFGQLGLAMLAAIAIVYLVLVITFGGAITPFAILFSLPFTIIGALLALFIAGITLDVSAMMGGLMLIGIVVTNAIVLIDRVLHKEKEGHPTRDAILEAGATRLRPILMTALATIGALLPMAFGLESSAMISQSLAITVIGGLVSSTLLTLIIVPIVYEFLSRFRKQHVED